MYIRHNYKTELCIHYIKNNYCKYGTRCCFAHGEYELRPNAVKDKVYFYSNDNFTYFHKQPTQFFPQEVTFMANSFSLYLNDCKSRQT